MAKETGCASCVKIQFLEHAEAVNVCGASSCPSKQAPCFQPLTTDAGIAIGKALGIDSRNVTELSIEFGAPGETFVVVRRLIADSDMSKVLEALRSIPKRG